MKALETYLRYSHQQMKPYSPQEAEKLNQQGNGPRINVILPADGSEVKGKVLEHDSEESLASYLSQKSQNVYKELDEDYDDSGEYSYSKGVFELPDED
jgi:homospermidine synthase